jgi:MinD superfamily P-loop ATPase
VKPRQVVVLSGKGGTGKTSVTASLVHLAARELPLVIADVDVDAANLDLVLRPRRLRTHAFESGLVARIHPELCIGCGRCYVACRFDAVVPDPERGPYRIDPIACEGCDACTYHCPAEAIVTTKPQVGEWYLSETAYGPLYHAHLFAGGDNSGKLVTVVKRQARQRALDDRRDGRPPLLIVDGPPGIGCPVLATLSGADLALLVVEPTPSGAHDLERVLPLVEHFNAQALVVLNKADISEARAEEIETLCRAQGVPVVARVPYDTAVTQAMVNGDPATAVVDGPVTAALRAVWHSVKETLAL